jgi:hypothetical protein
MFFISRQVLKKLAASSIITYIAICWFIHKLVLIKCTIVKDEGDRLLVESKELDLYIVKKDNILRTEDDIVEFDDKYVELGGEEWRDRVPIDPNANNAGLENQN